MSCEYKEKVLYYLRNDMEDKELEEHIEKCSECNAMVEGYLERAKELNPDIPKTEYRGDDKQLKNQIIKYNRGRGRILAFTFLGMILGFLSFHYTRDSFIVTRIIMAIPYKISEFIYINLRNMPDIYYSNGIGFPSYYFPQSMFITILAERITPILIGGAMYGSIGYFTGNKRIFTLSKYLRFVFLWCAVILVWIGAVFVGKEIIVEKNSNLEGINGFSLHGENRGSGFYEDSRADVYKVIRNALGDVQKLQEIEKYNRTSEEAIVDIYMGFGRTNRTIVNWKEKYMIMDTGRVVTIPDAFAGLIHDYYTEEGIFSKENSSVTIEKIEQGKDEVNTDEIPD